jgi:hypothetical protein
MCVLFEGLDLKETLNIRTVTDRALETSIIVEHKFAVKILQVKSAVIAVFLLMILEA